MQPPDINELALASKECCSLGLLWRRTCLGTCDDRLAAALRRQYGRHRGGPALDRSGFRTGCLTVLCLAAPQKIDDFEFNVGRGEGTLFELPN